MTRVPAPQVGDIPQPGVPVAQFTPPSSVVGIQSTGTPWTTSLFDCHQNQTNGIFFFFLSFFFSSIHELVIKIVVKNIEF